ncbi:MAG: hypothetical protein IT254_07510 [Chitinophagaceae bacterium]|nr:hypothetical protein [Bacteroidota bacterium]MCC6258150.1 hypothetical protein [Chitinophagaceae bacterium]MCW5916140.1 hypothetical protein [Ferruginibacter sp.]
MKNWLLTILISGICLAETSAQTKTNAQNLVFTNEDSLHQGISKQKTIISGYGSAFYQRDEVLKQSKASLERVVLFVGHQFNSKISFFSEMELENGLVVGGKEKGEISMEQAFLKFNLNSKQYLVAGLFIPRIGILNENHLPVNFNGVERPMVEQLIIPATWRELGVGFYGKSDRLPLLYSLAVMNGLNSADFSHGTGIRDGRAEGSSAWANNLAISASVQYNPGNFRFQVSGYAGGTVGLSKRGADSLKLNSGAFGTPVYLAEANAQYTNGPFQGKILFANIYYPDADKVNIAYAKNLATDAYGGYAEFGYDCLYHKQKESSLISFVRYEYLNLNATIPAAPKGIYDGTLKQQHLVIGLSYLPIPNVVIKGDVRLMHTGPQNPALVINPPPNALPYKTNNTLINLGIGYSF